MLFGKSYIEKHREKQEKLAKKKGRVKKFAWLPVKENYGRIVWLQYVYVDYGIYEGFAGDLEMPHRKPIYHLKAER